MLGLVGELSALSGSAIRDALASPGAPLAAAIRAIREAPRRRRTRRPGGATTTASSRSPRPAPRAPGWSRCRHRSACSARRSPIPTTVVEAERRAHLSVTNHPRPRGRLRDPRRRRAVGRAARRPADPGAARRSGARADRGLPPTALGNIIRAAPRPPWSPTSSSARMPCAGSPATSAAGSTSTRSSSGSSTTLRVLFSADRVAAFLFEEDGQRRMAASRGLSPGMDQRGHDGRGPRPRRRGHRAPAGRCSRPTTRTIRGSASLRAAVVQEGFDTACIAPLFDGDQPGAARHPRRVPRRAHPWTDDELDTMAALATQASVAIKAARQLRPARDLGGAAPVDPGPRRTRLNRLTSVQEIGDAIATELRQLIDYHNVRVYRLVRRRPRCRSPCRAGSASTSTRRRSSSRSSSARASPAGSPSTGSPQRLDDAATDPRAKTIAGTEDDLDESMLLAPMLFEDEVLGVLVLSKLGLRQFRGDDLRLLEIYASFAAQAMANADATERLREQSAALEQKVRGQRELLEITESILTTLDPPVLLGTIADRLGDADRLGQRRHRARRPGASDGSRRSSPAASTPTYYLQPWQAGETGLATWVLEHNEPVRVVDEFDDPRVRQPPERPGPRQPRLRAAARPRRRDRRPDPGAHRRGPGVQRRRVRAGPALRRPGLDRPPERRGPPRRRASAPRPTS